MNETPMVERFVAAWFKRQDEVKAAFSAKAPDNYEEIVKAVVRILSETDDYSAPDPDRVHRINDGDYQGTLVFIIGASGYQPSDYWYVKVGYGSCSGCDTLQAIGGYSDEAPTEEQVHDYMTLALHIVQGLRPMQTESA